MTFCPSIWAEPSISVAAVNQGGRRKGAACVYLESWHADIEEFLELKENVGDDARDLAEHIAVRQTADRPLAVA